jgi:hypothetical protein
MLLSSSFAQPSFIAFVPGQAPLMRYGEFVESQAGREFLLKSLVGKQNEPIGGSR